MSDPTEDYITQLQSAREDWEARDWTQEEIIRRSIASEMMMHFTTQLSQRLNLLDASDIPPEIRTELIGLVYATQGAARWCSSVRRGDTLLLEVDHERAVARVWEGQVEFDPRTLEPLAPATNLWEGEISQLDDWLDESGREIAWLYQCDWRQPDPWTPNNSRAWKRREK